MRGFLSPSLSSVPYPLGEGTAGDRAALTQRHPAAQEAPARLAARDRMGFLS